MTILEIEGRKIEVGDDFKTLTPQEQENVVREIAQNMGVQGRNSGVMGQINRGIAQGIGGIVDFADLAVNPAMDFIGFGYDDPFAGSESIKRGMDMIGADVAQGEPQTYGQQAARGVGDAASFLLPMGAGAKMLERGGPMAAKLGSSIMQPFTSAPVRATALELAAGGGSRVGGEYADEMSGEGNNALIRMGGELAGGAFAAMSPGVALRTGARIVNALPATGHAIQGTKAALLPFTEAGGRIKASDRLRSLVANPDDTLVSLRQPDIGNLTPSQRTGEQGIIELENYMALVDPVFRDDLARQTQQSRATLVDEAHQGFGSMDDARNFIANRREQFRTNLNAKLDEARQRADEAVRNVAPQMRETASSAIVRQEIDQAYSAARMQERALWDAVPSQATVDTSSLKDVFAQIIQNTPRAQSGDIPVEAIRLIDEFQGAETVREMHGLYSKLRQTAREAGSGVAPNANKARLANNRLASQ